MHSDETEVQIGHSLGFTEPTNFLKLFKRVVGSTPLDFRAAAAPKSGHPHATTPRRLLRWGIRALVTDGDPPSVLQQLALHADFGFMPWGEQKKLLLFELPQISAACCVCYK